MLVHVSAAITLDIYIYVTDTMQAEAAAKIEEKRLRRTTRRAAEKANHDRLPTLHGQNTQTRHGCISQISDHLWEGRYSPVWPDGKRRSRNVYAKTREECEALLPGLIAEMKAEIQAIKRSGDQTAIPDGVGKKKKQIAAYMRQHPEIANKGLIAKRVGVDKNTVRRYYDEIRKEV